MPISPNSLVVRLSKNYNLPLQIARTRWNYAKSKARSKDSGLDFVKALQVFHAIRAEPLPKSQSQLPVSRRKPSHKEMTQWVVPRNRRN